jgi:hypothetical protein
MLLRAQHVKRGERPSFFALVWLVIRGVHDKQGRQGGFAPELAEESFSEELEAINTSSFFETPSVEFSSQE